MRQILLGTLLASCLLPVLAQAQAAPAQAPQQPAPAQVAPAPAPAQAAPAPPTAPTPVLAPAAPPPAAPRILEPRPASAPAVVVLQPVPAPAPAPVAAPTTLPPPPPGYVYAPAPGGAPPIPYDAARRDQINTELKQVDGRLRELKQERSKAGIGGPIALMASGYGFALISSFVALASLATAESIEHNDWWEDDDVDWDNDGRVNHHDEQAARNTARAFAGLAAVGVGVGIGGSVWLAKRLDQRREHSPEIHELKERRRDLRQELRYSATLTPDRAELTLRTSF